MTSWQRFVRLGAGRARAFIMLIVLCILALVAIAVAAQLASAAGSAGSEVRVADDARARAAAETCLDMLQAYSDDYMRALIAWNEAEQIRIEANPRARDHAPYFDFDGLLDPDAPITGTSSVGTTRNDGDEFVPVFTTTHVFVPRSAADSEHRWGFVNLGSGSACLVRIEDNSDDGFFQSAASAQLTDGVEEGCDLSTDNGRVARCDHKEVRDRDNDGAVILATIGLFPIPPGAAPELAYDEAHARVGIRRVTSRDENADLGGELLKSETSVTLLGKTEICGRGGVDTVDFNFASTTCTCGDLKAQNYNPATSADTGCNCTACNAITQSPQLLAPTSVDPLLPPRTEGIPPALSGNYDDLLFPQSCMFYLDGGDVFWVYDVRDTAAKNQGAGGAVVADCKPGSKCFDKCDDDKAFGSPCAWDLTTASITCDAGQSPCWKPIAKLHDGAADLWLPATMPVGASKNWTSAADEVAFRTTAIPNVKSVKRFGGPAPFCGKPDICDDCDGRNHFLKESGDIETANDLTPKLVPSPAMLFVEAGGKDVRVRKTATSVRMPLSVVSNGPIKIDRDASLCCAECDCDNETNPPECFFAFNGPESPVGPAIRSSDVCTFDSRRYVTGDVHCRAVDIKTDGNVCIHGNVNSYDNMLSCDGDPAATCIRNTVREIGVFGLVGSKGTVIGHATVRTELDFGITAMGKVTIKDGGLRLGSPIEANGAVRLDNVGDVIDTNLNQFTVKKVLTYMETSW